MTEKAQTLIKDFKRNGWQTLNLYERLFSLAANSNEAFSFAMNFLKLFDTSATIFNDILSYIEKSQFSELIETSLNILHKHKNENAESVIEYASLQFPELLHNDLELIFELKPNESAYCADFPWRNLNIDKVQIFKSKLLDKDTEIKDKQKIFRCLLETRNLGIINFAYDYALNNKIFEFDNLEEYLLAHIEDVGFTKRGQNIESYCSSIPRHLRFKKNYFSNDRPIHTNKNQHPTWRLNAENHAYKFGGVIQESENNPFTHLITFDKIPKGLEITSIKSLTLGLHINELNEFGTVFYQHDEWGKPLKIGELKEIETYTDLPIKETEIVLAETPERWKFQSWGSSNSRENLFRIGGEPTWIQGAEVLTCPVSGEKMGFIMQLDTDLPDTENDEVYFGSGGICYIFWCNKTKVSGYLMQCT